MCQLKGEKARIWLQVKERQLVMIEVTSKNTQDKMYYIKKKRVTSVSEVEILSSKSKHRTPWYLLK